MPQIFRFDPNSKSFSMSDAISSPSTPGISRSMLVLFMITMVVVLGFAVKILFLSPLCYVHRTKPSTAAILAQSRLTPLQFTSTAAIAPHYGSVRLGAFSGEAAELAGLKGWSIATLGVPANYTKYREVIRNTYGLDLEDMNYYGVGSEGWEERLPLLRNWILMAGKYGDVTLALEPLGFDQYDVFADSSGMRAMRSIFQEAEAKGITLWIRFASEANLEHNPYSVYSSDDKADTFYQKAVWLKGYMPKNIKLVFSPLINTSVIEKHRQFTLLKRMLYGGLKRRSDFPWDRIGGTIYRTNVSLNDTYSAYYRYMSSLAPNTPFQICELGGPYSKRIEIKYFIKLLANGHWPKVQKVNLFARTINKRADPSGTFGFVEPDVRKISIEQAQSSQRPQFVDSWIKVVIASSARLGPMTSTSR